MPDIKSYLQEKRIQNCAKSTLATRERALKLVMKGVPDDFSLQDLKHALVRYRDSHKQNTFRQAVIYLVDYLKFQGWPENDIQQLKKMMPRQVKNTKRAADMLTADEENMVHVDRIDLTLPTYFHNRLI